MTLVFDTTSLSGLLDNDDEIIREVTKADYDRLLVPLAADAELRYGFMYGKKSEENLANYTLLKRNIVLEYINPNQDTAIIYADLAAWCRKHGKSLSNNDLWIAATSIQTGGSLLTLDKDYGVLPQIRLIDF